MTSKELTKLAVAALEDRKAEDVTVIDISEISPIADYFIIANGTNQNQLQACLLYTSVLAGTNLSFCHSIKARQTFKISCKSFQSYGRLNVRLPLEVSG